MVFMLICKPVGGRVMKTVTSKLYPGVEVCENGGVYVNGVEKAKPIDPTNPPIPESQGYPSIQIDGKRIYTHVLVARIVHPNPDDLPIVNHLDGNKYNHHPTNLEWTDHSGNSTHAYATGLRKDNVRVMVYDALNCEVTHHYSLQHAARHTGINAGHIHYYLKEHKGYLVDKRWAFCRRDRLTEEQFLEGVREYRDQFRDNSIAVYNIAEDYVVIYTSVAHAAKSLGIAEHLIVASLNSDVALARDGWRFYRGVDDLRERLAKDMVVVPVEPVDNPLRKPQRRKPNPIKVTNMNTGESEQWESVEAFCNFLGVKKNTMQTRLLRTRVGKATGYWNEFEVTYLSIK